MMDDKLIERLQDRLDAYHDLSKFREAVNQSPQLAAQVGGFQHADAVMDFMNKCQTHLAKLVFLQLRELDRELSPNVDSA